MRPLTLLATVVACFASSTDASAAVGCAKLQPSSPATTAAPAPALDAAVDDWFAKSTTMASNVDETFHEVALHVLAAFPQAERRYIWRRVVALACKLVTESSDLSITAKTHAVDDLTNKFYSLPPP